MNIVVFIKEVPIDNDVLIDAKTNNLIRSKQGKINPYDLCAIEEALVLKEKYGAKVSVVSMGAPNVKNSLYEALALGCDDAYLLSSRSFAGSDTLATAYTLAQFVRKLEKVDILLFGLKAIDADTGQVGPLVANNLKIPQVTSVVKILDVNKDLQTVDLIYNNEYENVTLKVSYPLVISVNDTINQPRYMTPLNIDKAFEKEIVIYDEKDLNCDLEQIGILGSPTKVINTFVEDNKARDVKMLNGSVADISKQIIEILNDKQII